MDALWLGKMYSLGGKLGGGILMDRIRATLVITFAGLLAGCSYAERIKDSYDYTFFESQEQREAENRAICERYGAVPGTDVFVQCMLRVSEQRSLQAAAPASDQNPFSTTTTLTPNGGIKTCQNYTNGAGTLSNCF